MRIAELFHSIQGEGELAGVPSVFIRTSGCNLWCEWCDTPYASWEPEFEEMGVEEVFRRASALLPNEDLPKHVVLTGGEPLIATGVVALTKRFAADGWHLTVETSGNVYQPVRCDLVSLSPKLSNSVPHRRANGRCASQHDKHRVDLPTLQRLIDEYCYQLKFVIVDERDLREIEDLLARLRNVDRRRVLLMPEGTDANTVRNRAHWIIRECQTRGFRYCPRLHIELFGNVRGR